MESYGTQQKQCQEGTYGTKYLHWKKEKIQANNLSSLYKKLKKRNKTSRKQTEGG
jgi:glutathione peroxidase-family protein